MRRRSQSRESDALLEAGEVLLDRNCPGRGRNRGAHQIARLIAAERVAVEADLQTPRRALDQLRVPKRARSLRARLFVECDEVPVSGGEGKKLRQFFRPHRPIQKAGMLLRVPTKSLPAGARSSQAQAISVFLAGAAPLGMEGARRRPRGANTQAGRQVGCESRNQINGGQGSFANPNHLHPRVNAFVCPTRADWSRNDPNPQKCLPKRSLHGVQRALTLEPPEHIPAVPDPQSDRRRFQAQLTRPSVAEDSTASRISRRS